MIDWVGRAGAEHPNDQAGSKKMSRTVADLAKFDHVLLYSVKPPRL